jgi:two-component system CheB/CheR fusion protein
MLSPNAQTDDLVRLLTHQSTEVALILLNSTGEIVAWLGAAETIFGYTSGEVLGKPPVVLFTPEDVRKGVPKFELETARQNVPAEDDRWMLRKDGIRFWATGVLQPLKDKEGRIVGFAKILRNRTDLKGQLDGLEKRIQSLEASSDRKNKFISTLAHELRNPLASLSTAAALLDADSQKSEDAAYALTVIQRQVDVMRRLIEDLLDVTRISTGKVQLELGEEDLNEIVRSASDACRPIIDERTHRFHLLLSDAPMTILADAARLQQVFVNLIENAARYTQNGGEIWVKVFPESREGVVKVEDSGIGISAEVLPRIFEMFTQAEFSGGKDGGLGIGLSVVKDLTRLHGGSVQVRSDGVGKGSEFVVRLPLAGADKGRPDSPA